ncbi:MAG: hypothetical protein MZW92_15065 [Comamonadaceae bacterium]|nr:hypothetical protein [Comamonadaceae bacterium]
MTGVGHGSAVEGRHATGQYFDAADTLLGEHLLQQKLGHRTAVHVGRADQEDLLGFRPAHAVAETTQRLAYRRQVGFVHLRADKDSTP